MNTQQTTYNQTTAKLMRMAAMAAMLMIGTMAWAQNNYLFFSNGHFLGIDNGAIDAPATFNRDNCVWTTTVTAGDSGTLSMVVSGTTYYLVNTGGTLSVSTTAGDASTFTLSSDGRQWSTPNGHLQYSGTAWNATGGAADNGYQLQGYYSFLWYRIYNGNTLNGYLFLSTSTEFFSQGQPYLKGQTTEDVWAMLQYDATSSLLINTNTGQFMIANNIDSGASNAVHLEVPTTLGTSAQFQFSYNSVGHYFNIIPKGSSQSLNCFSNNTNNVGLYSTTDDGSKWHVIDQSLAEPSVSTVPDGTTTLTSPVGGTLYYTIDGSRPAYQTKVTPKPDHTTLEYTEPFILPIGTTPVNAVYAHSTTHYVSKLLTHNVLVLEPPVILIADGGSVTITAVQGAEIFYTTDGSTPTDASTQYTVTFNVASGVTVKAIAKKDGVFSIVASRRYIAYVDISSFDGINDMEGFYRLSANIESPSQITSTFKGILDGNNHVVRGLTTPLFASLDGATVKNLMFDEVNITSGTNVGAVAGSADGATRIYNCGVLGGSVGGNGYVGGILGELKGTSCVVNCFSYATVNGGTWGAGIVGYNSFASTNATLQTMVMNCMFYGNVASGTNIAPVYGGEIINNNSATGLNNFNYFSAEDFTSTITTYNCALGAERRFLERFEFYRQILNSNRELATWYITGSTDDSRTVMYKWVLDKSIAPYPILKPHGKYTSIINYDASAGTSLGTLSVTISGTGSNAPTGASITTSSLTLTRTDKDPENYNFNYDKVQLPYYNDVGTKNYTENKVVTGWKITAITGGTEGTFTGTGSDVTFDGEGNVATMPYNFADRNCTKKDLYSVTGRIFSQGAYFDVPYGVTAITIEPYWATAAYLSDPNFDKTYNTSYTAYDITAMGTRYTNDAYYTINGSSQKVYTTMGNAITALNRPDNSNVYDYAVVLVGNYHHYYGNNSIVNDKKGFTIMSADLDFDNEPDNCFIFQLGNNRMAVSPIRFDFLCWTGLGMAQKPSNSTRMPSIGIMKPRGWFEVTNTCIAQFQELEYDWSGKDAETGGSPLILMGGTVEQIVSSNDGDPKHTRYILLGGNVWFKMFNNGIHSDKTLFTPHIPISVTGGDYQSFYLSGMFRPDAQVESDNAECYISGGRFGEMAGAGMQKVDGNVYWQIDRADIEHFYGGGINSAKPITGNVTTEIFNSNVGVFCGGPKFGDMSEGKHVVTTAEGCTFGEYYGAGYGGTSFNRVRKQDKTNGQNYNYNDWVNDSEKGYKRQYETTTYSGGDAGSDYITVNAISTNYEYELFAFAGFGNDNNCGRFYVNYASLSLATTRSVTSNLAGCTVLGNFYGGGNRGKVDGDVTSTLIDCTVNGNAFGAGFSATAPTVDVMKKEGFVTQPSYNGESGTYTQGVFPSSDTYTWKQAQSVSTGNEFEETDDKHYILTTEDMNDLGTVSGNTSITLQGNTTVSGSVFGGGDESAVKVVTGQETTTGNTEVKILGKTKVFGNIYGGGNMGEVGGNTKVVVNQNGN